MNNELFKKKHRFSDTLLFIGTYGSTIITLAVVALLILFICYKGISNISFSFLTSVPSFIKGTKGIAGNIVNTLYIIILTMLFCIPLGVGSAIYLNEYAKKGKFVNMIEFAMEILTGIPSIVYGLFGLLFFNELLHMGFSLLSGACTLTLMVLPLITCNTQEALKSVPDRYRNGALSLGAGKWYMIRTILLPVAMPVIVTGILLSIGRVIGESAALLFTAGSAKGLPKQMFQWFTKVMQSGGTLSVQLYLSATSEADFETSYGIAFILLIFALLIHFAAKYFQRKVSVENGK